jgi:hypothetical protein
VIAFRGKALEEFNVIVTTQQDIVVIFVIVAGKKLLGLGLLRRRRPRANGA